MNQTNVLVRPKLLINNNVMQVEDSVIQISNISWTEIGPKPKDKFPIWTLIVIAISVYTLTKTSEDIIVLGAILALAVSIIILYKYLDISEYYLIIWMNSGNFLCISSKDSDFLKQAQGVMINCFNGLHEKNKEYIINFNDCTILQSQFGEHNNVIYGEKNNEN